MTSHCMPLLNMVQMYNERASKILGVEDPYIAYCLDEAVTLIIGELREKEGKIILRFTDREKQSGNKLLMSLVPETKKGGD